MKQYILSFLCACFFSSGFAQHQIGISGSVDATNAVYFESLDGAGGSDGGTGYSLSLAYYYSINQNWTLQSGLTYRNAKHTITPNLPPGEMVADQDYSRNLISIPVVFRRYFGESNTRFFLDLGGSFDFERNVPSWLDDNSGVSILFSPGLEQKLNDSFALNLAPQMQIHSLIPFQQDNHQRRLIAAGIEISLLYSLH
ncbi:outer membrane beta-barrel protein [Catalinimonas sp. 4WD22]|uniref:outer membrane beta-barrel protein n=1 Tax=Catalinimonas locisalis TaxID=3133978 RepID=UPI0031011770